MGVYFKLIGTQLQTFVYVREEQTSVKVQINILSLVGHIYHTLFLSYIYDSLKILQYF